MISTVLHNQSVYLTPALIFALVDTVLPFGAGAEIGRYFTRAATRRPHAAATTRIAAAPVVAAGREKVA